MAGGRLAAALALALLLPAGPAAATPAGSGGESESGTLRVCADPNNMPFSNDRGEGFENRIAEFVARELGYRGVAYTWWAQRRGFIRNTLKAGACDVVIGVPAGMEMVATTRPYYRSTYVFVERRDRGLKLASLRDPRLGSLRIGVHLIGDDGANTPPADALGEEGIIDNVVGYMIYGDYSEPAPPSRLVEAVATGEVDVGAAWGPLAGYFAQRAGVPLDVVPIADTGGFAPLAFQFDIAMGVRHGDEALRGRLDALIAERGDALRAILAGYGVPLLPVSAAAGKRGGGDD
ncbi:substrate-binding domain-containing protein [Propylenella binzhouense]